MSASFFLKSIFHSVHIYNYIDLLNLERFIIYKNSTKLTLNDNELYVKDNFLFLNLEFLINNKKYLNEHFLKKIDTHLKIIDIFKELEPSFIFYNLFLKVNLNNKQIDIYDSLKKYIVKIVNENSLTFYLNEVEIYKNPYLKKLHDFTQKENLKISLNSLDNLNKIYKMYKICCY
jgi:hypothetical protein